MEQGAQNCRSSRRNGSKQWKEKFAKILETEQEKFPQSKVYPALLLALLPAFPEAGVVGCKDVFLHVSPTIQIAFLILWVHWISFTFRIYSHFIIFVCIFSWFIWTLCIFQDVFHMICENISAYFLHLTWQCGILIIVLGAFSPCYRDLWTGKPKLLL